MYNIKRCIIFYLIVIYYVYLYINIYNNIVLCVIFFILINICKLNWSKNFICRWKVMFCVNEIVKMFGRFFLLMFCFNLVFLKFRGFIEIVLFICMFIWL